MKEKTIRKRRNSIIAQLNIGIEAEDAADEALTLALTVDEFTSERDIEADIKVAQAYHQVAIRRLKMMQLNIEALIQYADLDFQLKLIKAKEFLEDYTNGGTVDGNQTT